VRLFRKLFRFSSGESGVTLIETVVALAILGMIGVTFLNGLTTASKAVLIADRQTTAINLAQSQMEWVKNVGYSYDTTEYSPAPIPGSKDYIDYSAAISAQPLNTPDNGIQKITVRVYHSGEPVMILEGYKVDR